MKRNLLCVDDERDNLIVFRAAFGKHFNVLEASSAAEALEVFAAHDVPLLVADQRMPDQTGVELCEIVAREYPQTIRMILTGFIDSEAMMEAINTGHVYNFVTKPWEKEALLSILLRGMEAYDLAISNHALLEQVAHTDRCATLGRMAAGVAHEIRNQLVMLPLIELLEIKHEDDDELMQLAAVARETHDRLNELVDEVMAFVRKDGATKARTLVNLADLTREALALAVMDKSTPRALLKLNIRKEPEIRVHKAKIQQVLLNLVRNAVEALDSRADGEVRIIVDQAGSEALLSVCDNGPGIEAANLERIWEPFFSTKGEFGNGLGLDLCRQTVEAHGGVITCDSRFGQGAQFTIRLPLEPVS